MIIAVTGPEGNLGWELQKIGAVPMVCDITNPDDIDAAYRHLMPDVIINCAAYTDVDGAETNEERALAVNTRGIANLREIVACRIIHISTSYVFNGRKHFGGYSEKDRPNPLEENVYAFSKWAGECVFLTPHTPGDTLVRTVGLYGGHKPDFIDYVMDNLEDGKSIRIVDDVRFNPTYIPHLAEALMKLAESQYPIAVLNLASDEILSRYDFAVKIAEIFGYDRELIIPIHQRDFRNWVAKRPKNAGLDVKLAKGIGFPIYSVVDGLLAMEEVYA